MADEINLANDRAEADTARAIAAARAGAAEIPAGTRARNRGQGASMIAADINTLKHAAELLEADAQSLREGHNIDPLRPNWSDEPDARADHDDALCTALRLRMLARRIREAAAVPPELTSGAPHA